ncbi:stationary phase growth adaptation protein, partial [Mycobacterium tuberculosis]
SEFYFVPFKVYRERKKLRLHVTSAYPVKERPSGKPVSFFKIAHNLLRGKPLPKPHM